VNDKDTLKLNAKFNSHRKLISHPLLTSSHPILFHIRPTLPHDFPSSHPLFRSASNVFSSPFLSSIRSFHSISFQRGVMISPHRILSSIRSPHAILSFRPLPTCSSDQLPMCFHHPSDPLFSPLYSIPFSHDFFPSSRFLIPSHVALHMRSLMDSI